MRMKVIKQNIYAALLCSLLVFSGGCDQDFVEVNTNPYAITSIDPALLFAGAQRTHQGNWTAEHTIVQHFVSPYDQGATLNFNFNQNIDDVSTPKWNQSYPTALRNMIQALNILGPTTDRVNLRSMIRIWKAQVFMGLVDSYGNVPYFEAGRAVSDGIFYPVYDDGEVIYEDLYKEITESLDAFDPSADEVSADLFYGRNAENPAVDKAEQVAKWKKLGNSLLLRLGMRYSKVDPSKAASIVAEAFAGGVMTSNADNAYVKYDGSLFSLGENLNLRNFSQFNYAAEPFVDQLRTTNDPRGKFMIAQFPNPAAIDADLSVPANEPDTVLANQFGVPIGVNSVEIADDVVTYRGQRGGGLAYSQFNVWALASPAAPDFYVTYAQTSLLLAEARVRGWITTGTAKDYYENGIKADMAKYSLYPGTTPITNSQIQTYLDKPTVDFDLAATDEEKFELINIQYWIVNIRNGSEAFANFRRSEYPALTPNMVNDNFDYGFPRRLSYPDAEASANTANYLAGAAGMGDDSLIARVFWDE